MMQFGYLNDYVAARIRHIEQFAVQKCTAIRFE